MCTQDTSHRSLNFVYIFTKGSLSILITASDNLPSSAKLRGKAK